MSPASSSASGAPSGVVIGERVRPVKKRAEAADRDADLLGRLADRSKLSLALDFGREVVFEVVVELDAVEARNPWRAGGIHEGSSALGYGKAQRLIDFFMR